MNQAQSGEPQKPTDRSIQNSPFWMEELGKLIGRFLADCDAKKANSNSVLDVAAQPKVNGEQDS